MGCMVKIKCTLQENISGKLKLLDDQLENLPILNYIWTYGCPRVSRSNGVRVDFVLRGKVVMLHEVLREDDTLLVTASVGQRRLGSKRTEKDSKFPEPRFPQSQKHMSW